MALDQQVQLKKLRDILLHEDAQRVRKLEIELDILRAKIDDTDELLEKLDPVIADSITRKISDSKEDMADALAPIMGLAIKHQIADSKDDMVDALYPIIGSTIRKSIADAMRNLAISVNEKIDKALSFQNLFRRAKSRVTGVSEAELAIKEALPFQVHEIFLIHKETGILLAHVSQEINPAETSNQEIISGMLTAIREFANTAFKKNGKHQLHQIQYDDMQIHLEDGRYSYLAVVTEGTPPANFPEQLMRTEQKIHNLFYKALRAFDGNTSQFESSNNVLDKLLISFLPEEKKAARKPKASSEKSAAKGFTYILLTLFIIAATTVGFLGFPEYFPWFSKPSKNISMIDPVTTLNQIKSHLANNFSFTSNFRYILDGDILTIYGEAPNEIDKILVSKAITNFTLIKTLVNNLTFQNALSEMAEQIKNQLKSTAIYFRENSSQLSRENAAQLSALLPILRAYPKQNIYLHGHSDIQGDETANKQISQKRANNVKQYLEEIGGATNKIDLVSWGTEKPVAPNDTKAGREQNRRVNFSFSKEF